jgi:hypothetical protein
MNQETKIKKRLYTIGLLVLLCFSIHLSAQETKATATLDSNVIQIGQQIKLKLSVQYRVDKGKQMKIHFPEIADTIRKEVEIVNQSKIDTIINKNDPFEFTQTKTLYITSFDSGYWAIPPFKFIVNNDTNGIYTDALLLQVNTIPVDTTLDIKSIKGPYTEKYTWLDWLKDNMYVVYGGLAGILLIILAIYLIRKYRKEQPEIVVDTTPKLPAHTIAILKLEQLKDEKLWETGRLKLYHSKLTDILREYIENRFSIQAMEQTSDEILFGFRNIAIDEDSKIKLKQILMLSDLVKFAKEQPLPFENEQSMSNAHDFINGTKREDTTPLS